METILINTVLSILGAALMIWANAARKGEKFDPQKWVEENIEAICFTIAGILLITIIFSLAPDAMEMIKTITGLSLTDTSAGWFTFGALLYEGLRKIKRSKNA